MLFGCLLRGPLAVLHAPAAPKPLRRVCACTLALAAFFLTVPLVIIGFGFAGATTCNSHNYLFPFQVVPFHTTQLVSTILFVLVWRKEMNALVHAAGD